MPESSFGTDPILLRLLKNREINDSLNCYFQSQLQAAKHFVDRLGLDCELEGHGGCVNCIEWNEQGSILASGSDDLRVMLWDPFRQKQITSIETGHHGNIFSVKFMPQSNDNLIASAAGDGKVKLHWIDDSRTSSREPNFQCTCHAGRVKRLATAPDVSYLLWSGSEDGTVMQYDLRTPHDCSSGPSQILINLISHAGNQAEVKCIAINPLRTELLAVGANDPYVRLYDRRMIKLTSIQFRPERPRANWRRHNFLAANSRSEENLHAIPSECVQYFAPAHLPRKLDDYRRRFRSLASTYVTFDPSGRHLLVNLGGEQIYLYDCTSPTLPTIQFPLSLKDRPVNGCISNSALPAVAEQLKNQANAAFHQRQYSTAIRLYSKALTIAPKSAVLYSNRAIVHMKRNWDGDTYAALRDCCCALKLDASQMKAHLRLARCLQDLGWSLAASECLQFFRDRFPEQSTCATVKAVEQDILTSLTRQQEQQLRTESTSETDEEREENRQREDEEEELLGGNSSETSESRRSISLQEIQWRSNAWDYMSRYCGHCNTTTDIKEANFFGSEGQYILAGSDDGCIFLWNRQTEILEKVLRGDDAIVNCVQPHPTTCLVATSGIDSVVRLWNPLPQESRFNERVVEDIDTAAQANQRRMNADPFEMILMNMGPVDEAIPVIPRRIRTRQFLNPDRSDDEDSEARGAIQCRPS